MSHARTITRLVADSLPSQPWTRTSIALGRPYRPQYRYRRFQPTAHQTRIFTRTTSTTTQDDSAKIFDPWDQPVGTTWNDSGADDSSNEAKTYKPVSAKRNTLVFRDDGALLLGYDVRVGIEAAKIQGRTSAEVHSIMRVAVSEGKVDSILKVQACVDYLLRDLGEQPSPRLYSALILAQCRADGSVMEVERLLKEMHDEGFEVDSGVCHDILKVLSVHPDYILRNEVLDFMREKWFQLSEGGWHDIVAGLIREGSLEMATERLEEMRRLGIRTLGWLYDMLMYSLAEKEEMDEVLRLLQLRTRENNTNISGTMWYYLLDVSARLLHYDLASFVWKSRVRPRYLNPSSGICVNVMTLAARNRDTELAQDVFDLLGKRDTVFEAQHYELLIEAYVNANAAENAFYILSAMQRAGVVPTTGTIRRLLAYFRVDNNSTRVGRMFALLKDIKEKGDPVPVAAMNLLIEVTVLHRNVEQAMQLYHALSEICIGPPDITTFNLLLKLCHRLQRKDLALTLAGDMIAARVIPDKLTYDRMMLVCLQNGEDYEDGVRYYKEMRAKGFELRFGSALILVRTLTKYSDERVDEVLDDLETMDLPLRIIELKKWVKENFGNEAEVELPLQATKAEAQAIAIEEQELMSETIPAWTL